MKELVLVFFRLGWLGFGGPIATIAMMEEETRRRRGWLDQARFTEVYAICKMLPGPVATQVAIYLGYIRKGRLGGLVAGLLFILPSFLIVLGLSALYSRRGAGPGETGAFEALQAAALAVIVTSTLQLARPIWKNWKWIVTAIASGWIVWSFPLWEPLVILGSGLGGALAVARPRTRPIGDSGTVLLDLFWVCFKAGAFVFGTGLAIIPLLEGDVVRRQHWLTHSEFMDGLAIGQVTPGPVVITVTFIGYRVAGLPGALLATLGIFLPCFLNILYIVPVLWKRVSGTPAAAAFTAWALPAVVGGIFATSGRLAHATLHSWTLAGLFAASLALSLRFKPPAWLLIPGAGVVGALLQRLS
jgi:chromate transporter